MKDEQQALLHLPSQAIFSGRIQWGNMPWSDHNNDKQGNVATAALTPDLKDIDIGK